MMNLNALCHAYLDAKRFVIASGFGWEVDWQANVDLRTLTEKTFLREYAWVVLNSGFRESIIRLVFPSIECSFLNWESGRAVWDNRSPCRRKALAVFNSRRKINAILRTCEIVSQKGFETVRADIEANGPAALLQFPFMGTVTSLHLAKNMGIQTVKPDRHLRRIASAYGFKTPREMCEAVHQIVGDKLSEIDIVFWRFAALNPKLIRSFQVVSFSHDVSESR